MELPLPTLSIVLGLAFLLPAAAAAAKPDVMTGPLRGFPRSVGVGCVLVLIATAWFVMNLRGESIADFEPMKPYLMMILVALGVGVCLFLQDFIAVRGLAALLMLAAKLMVDAGRPHLGANSLILVNQTLAYVFVVFGMWLAVSPWRLRNWIQWGTATHGRLRGLGAVFALFGAFLLALGLVVFRNL